MNAGLSRVLPQGLKVGKIFRLGTGIGAQRGLSGIGLGLALYGVAAALLILRAPAILGDRWSWLALVLIPGLTILVGGLRTGTALALVLVYAFASATAMAVQGYRLGWGEAAQLQYVFSHFCTVFFLASSVALISLIRVRQQALEDAQELVRRYVSEDETTGLLTTGAFEAAASRELSRSYRTSRPFLLVSIDLTEYFKVGQGSAAMGTAERMVGEILCAETRGNQDLWTMWQPDIYLGLLVETDDQAVEPALKRVLVRVAKAPEFAGQSLVDRARFGIASYPADGANLDMLLDLAVGELAPLEELHLRLAAPSWAAPLVTVKPKAKPKAKTI